MENTDSVTKKQIILLTLLEQEELWGEHLRIYTEGAKCFVKNSERALIVSVYNVQGVGHKLVTKLQLLGFQFSNSEVGHHKFRFD